MPSSIVNQVQTSIPATPITLEDVDFTLEDIQSILDVIGESTVGLANTLFLKFQSDLNQGIIENEWKKLTIFPIYTVGYVCEYFPKEPKFSECRPISRTSLDFQVFERLLTKKIIDHLENNCLLSKHHYCLHFNQTCLTDEIEDFEENDASDLIYLEWKNAFESIPHNHLIAKLKSYGISGKVLKWIEGFLNNQTQTVEFKNDHSDPLLITSGVPRGSILGRILFLIYINDLFEGIQSDGKILADYCTLFRSVKYSCDRDILQQDLQKIEKWCNKWLLHFCDSQCKVDNIGISNPLYDYYMNKLLIDKYKRKRSNSFVPPDCQSTDHNRIVGEPIYDRNSDVADKANFSNLCKIYDHIFSKDTRFPILETDPKMNINVTDLVSFGDLEDAARVSKEMLYALYGDRDTVCTVRHFHPGVYRCTRVIPFEDHEPVFIYHHESIDPGKIVRQAYLMMKDFNRYYCRTLNMINIINRADWTLSTECGIGVTSDESDDEYDEERLTKWLKKKRMGKDKRLFNKRKSYTYFAIYENASCLKRCVKNECIEYSDINSTHYTVISPQLNRPIAMAAEVVCSIEPWKLGKVFQDISSQKCFALMINSWNQFMDDHIATYLGLIKDSDSRIRERYPNMQFTSVKETELKFNMTDFNW